MSVNTAENSIILNNRYEILEQIASGKTGDIYLCCDLKKSRQLVALRVLADALAAEPQALTLFLHQFRLAQSLNHKNIVQVFDYFEEEDLCLYSMEYLKGGNLSGRIQQTGISFDEVHQILNQLCEGLNEIHQSGIVHGALQPGKILFTEDGSAKIAGAGFAHIVLGNGNSRSAGSEATIGYLSPEQFRHGPVDQRADIYALGLLGYKMITGQLPGSPIESPEEVQKRFEAEAPAPRTLREDCPEELSEIIAKAVSLEPSKRFQTVEDLQDALDGREQKEETDPSTALTIVPGRPDPASTSKADTKDTQEEIFKPVGFWTSAFLTVFVILLVGAIVFVDQKRFSTSDKELLVNEQESSKEQDTAPIAKTEEPSKPAAKTADKKGARAALKTPAAALSSTTESVKKDAANKLLLDLKAAETSMAKAKRTAKEKKSTPASAPKKAAAPAEQPEKKTAKAVTAAEAAKPKPSSEKAAANTDELVHVVRYRGETLSIIADWYTGSIHRWKKLAKANPSINAAQVELGDKIILPRSLVVNDKPFQRSHIRVVRQRMKGRAAAKQ